MRIVGGRLSGRRFGAPSGKGTRPTSDRVREALGSALQSRNAFAGAHVLDLFAGSGALSFEALSRGAAEALLVDHDAQAIEEIKKSARELGLEDQARTLRIGLGGNPVGVVRKLPAPPEGFDLVFADAPYAAIESVPPLLAALLAARKLASGARIVIEHPVSHRWVWAKGLASDADYRYGQTQLSLGVYEAKGTQ
ncbi:MAG: RsmD family RNA methyltransferase [Myxococcales bacterium]|nr:RsmD family RNA methyltransferase [Myxococcales bacterium]